MSPSKIPCSGVFNCLSGQRLAALSVSQRLLRPAATDGGRSLDPLRPGKLSERAFHGLSNRLPHAGRYHFAPGSRMGGQGLFSFCGTSHHAAGRSQPSLSRSALSERCARGLGGRVALVECLRAGRTLAPATRCCRTAGSVASLTGGSLVPLISGKGH